MQYATKKGITIQLLNIFTKAAELGDADAHYHLGIMHRQERGVEKDEERSNYHDEKAAIGGHPQARRNLGCTEEINGNIERAVKHFIISAKLGDEVSMKELWRHYAHGNITKEDLDATLRAHQSAKQKVLKETQQKPILLHHKHCCYASLFRCMQCFGG